MKIALVALLFMATVGCHTLTSAPVEVAVVDAEVGQPINGATVDAHYSLLRDDVYLWPPALNLFCPLGLNIRKAKQQVTDKDGCTTIQAPETVALRATCPGYLEPTISWGEHIVPVNGKVDSKQATIRLYRDPVPTITIVVPDGYRGPLLVEYRPVDRWLQGDVGQREFSFFANKKGYVGIAATPLLLTIRGEMQVRYANGDHIPEWDGRLGDDDVALRWVASNGTQMIYAVGTKSDEESLPPLIYDCFAPNSRTMNQDSVDRLFREAANSPGQ